jgi:hypothetical protein
MVLCARSAAPAGTWVVLAFRYATKKKSLHALSGRRAAIPRILKVLMILRRKPQQNKPGEHSGGGVQPKHRKHFRPRQSNGADDLHVDGGLLCLPLDPSPLRRDIS